MGNNYQEYLEELAASYEERLQEESELCSDVTVRSKDGLTAPWSDEKLLRAINASAVRARGIDPEEGEDGRLSAREEAEILYAIKSEVEKRKSRVIGTEKLHAIVEQILRRTMPDVGQVYFDYHSWRLTQNESFAKISRRAYLAASDGDLQNANADSSLGSTLKCFTADYTEEEMYEQYFLTAEERKATKDGYIYVHDKNARRTYTHNCCLFKMGEVISKPFEVNGVWYNSPKTLDVAFDVIGDITLMAGSQQYGGFTIPRIDSILVPYAEMSYQKYLKKYLELGIDKKKAEAQAEADVEYDFRQGFQGLEIKFNTVASSRGDYPFITITLGLDTTKWGRMASICALQTREGGQGLPGKKKAVLFPKIAFLYDKNLHSKGCINEDVYEAGISCSAKAMYPDWLSLTGEGYISSMYKKYGIDGVISPMGCRAFLSPWFERGGMEPADEADRPIFEGRFNIGAISLNLPMILAKARKENRSFYDVLNYYLEMIRNIHIRTYKALGEIKASRNPLAFCCGGFHGGYLKPTDKIAPLLKSATASFGVTALNELQRLFNGKSILEDGKFALEVMQFINAKIQVFKKADGNLYAVYGTPAENLCGKQVTQFRSLYGVVENVSDRSYVTNSFHCHVTENISPIEKQDAEYRFWELFNGGKIQYCRYKLGYNKQAIKTLINRAMEMGFYEGVNLELSYCDDCGYNQVDMGDVCPKCGSIHITTVNRMNGYLGFSRVGRFANSNGSKITYNTRFSSHKMAEFADRVSM